MVIFEYYLNCINNYILIKFVFKSSKILNFWVKNTG